MTTTMEPKTSTGIRFIVNRPEFAAALQSLAGVASGKFKPILGCVHIEAVDNTLKLRTTNLEMSMEIDVVQVQVERQGVVLVSVEKLSAIARETTDDTLTLELSGDTLSVRWNNGKTKLLTMDPKDFPPAPQNEGEGITIDGASLKRMTEGAAFAISDEPTRYMTNGALMAVEKKSFAMVATETHVLSYATAKVTTADKRCAIVPGPAIRLLDKMIDPEAEVEIFFRDNSVTFKSGGTTLTTILCEGAFPPYLDIIPRESDCKATIDRDELIRTIRQAMITAEVSDYGVKLRLSFSKGGLSISSREVTSGDSTVNAPCKYEGKDLEIGVNSRFMLEALRASDADEITIGMNAPNRPLLLGLGGTFQCVLMPTNLQ